MESVSLLRTSEGEWNEKQAFDDGGDDDDTLVFSETDTYPKDPESRTRSLIPSWTLRLPSAASHMWLLNALISCFTPSFVSALWESPVEKKPRHTAYLDGLRGAAAWTVYNYHLAYILDKTEKFGYGYAGKNWELWKLPILRVLYEGSFSVSLFFVISGFALSIVPVRAMRQKKRDPGAFVTKLASAIFRRPMRLYLPSYISSLLVVFFMRAGYFVRIAHRQKRFEHLVSGQWNFRMWAVLQPTFGDQLSDWAHQTLRGETKYNPVLWTITREFNCSLALYLTHAALYPMPRRHRTLIGLVLIACLILQGSYSMPLFWSGLILADHTRLDADEDLDLLKSRKGSIFYSATLDRVWTSAALGKARASLARVGPWLVLLVALFLASEPEEKAEGAAGFGWIPTLTPEQFTRQTWRFWYSVGAVCLVWAVSRIPSLVRFFSSPLMQYAGRLSFSFYLVHALVQAGIGRYIFYYCYRATGKADGSSAVLGFVVAYPILLAVTVYVADMYMRLVDEPIVNLGSKLQRRFFTEME